MSKYLLCFILSFIIFILFSLPVSVLAEENSMEEYLQEMDVVAENRHLALYLNKKTTQIAVETKQDGNIWFSNPLNIDEKEQIATGNVKSRLNSQFRIVFDRETDFNRTRDNFNHSIEAELFEIKLIENGVKIDYQIGEEWRTEQHMPQFVAQDRFQSLILEEMDSRTRSQFEDNFVLVNVTLRREDEKLPEVTAIDEQELFGDLIVKHPDQGTIASGSFIGDFLDKFAEFREDLEDRRDVTREHLEHFIDNPVYFKEQMPPFIENDLIEDLRSQTEYNALEVNQDLLGYNMEPIQPDIEVFYVPLEYSLEEKNLLVTVNTDEIEYPSDVYDEENQLRTYPLHSIEMMPYFGARYKDSSGKILVPDGSGGLINFSAGELTGDRYLGTPIYGNDYTIASPEAQSRIVNQTVFPVYGIITEEKSFMAIIESGDPVARINAFKAGRNNSFNVVYPVFNILARDSVSLGAFGELELYQEKIIEENIKIRYSFFSEKNSSYAELARHYGDYLESKFDLKPEDNGENNQIPLYLDIVGNVLKRQPVLGVPRDVVTPLTDYGQSEVLVSQIMENGLENINLSYIGWLKGGIWHDYPKNIKFDSTVGGKEDFKEFAEFLSENRINFFPEVSFLSIYENNFLDGFRPNRDAAYILDQDPLTIYDYNKVNRSPIPDTERYLISPTRLEDIVSNFMKDYNQYNISGLSLRHLGEKLYSDLNNKEHVDRTRAANINKEQIKNIKENDLEIISNLGNAYTLENLHHIKNIPLTTSGFKSVDQDIPFYQIALHGLIDFTGEPLNLTSDYEKACLQYIEVGAAPYFKVAHDPAEWLKETLFSDFYSINFNNWQDKIVDYYHTSNKILSEVRNQRIINHAKLENGVFQTTYENGIKIKVNYNEQKVIVEDQEEKYYYF